MRRHPETLQIAAFVAGVGCAVLGAVLTALWEDNRALALVGLGFAVVGAGLVAARLGVVAHWQRVPATITRVGPTDPPTYDVRYDFRGTVYDAPVEDVPSGRLGSRIDIYIDPSQPARPFGVSAGTMLLGAIFLSVGLFLALGLLFGWVTIRNP